MSREFAAEFFLEEATLLSRMASEPSKFRFSSLQYWGIRKALFTRFPGGISFLGIKITSPLRFEPSGEVYFVSG